MIVKRAMKGRIRMELRIIEVDKGSAARVTNTHEAGPFDELRDRLIPPIRSLAFTGKNHISTHYLHSLQKQGIKKYKQ